MNKNKFTQFIRIYLFFLLNIFLNICFFIRYLNLIRCIILAWLSNIIVFLSTNNASTKYWKLCLCMQQLADYICTLHCLLRSAPCWIMELSIPLHPWLAATWRGVKPSWNIDREIESERKFIQINQTWYNRVCHYDKISFLWIISTQFYINKKLSLTMNKNSNILW